MTARRPWRAAPLTAALVLVAAVVVPVFTVAATGDLVAAAPLTRTYGGGPVDDIVAAAEQYQRPECGLARDQLAAMMLAPTFSETGSPSDKAPSPMTLSRWDTQAALWAFGDPTTAYQRAFWHPGIGLWQFDSAGYWDLTAADAINTQTAARQAAQVMSSRFCASSSTDVVAKMKYAWSPWYGCASGSVNCVDVYNQLYDGTALRNIVRDEAVTRLGGMQARTCRVTGIGEVACHLVDPSKAEGYRGFASPTGAPTPITTPFYVFRANGREYRYWLRQDSGYDRTVIASKPVRSDARTSLTWSTVEDGGAALCDTTAARGVCEPFGVVDRIVPAPGAVLVSGWAIDPDSAAATNVHLYVDGVGRANIVASLARPDVGAAYPAYGADHGFDQRLSVTPGRHDVCVFWIDQHGAIVGNVLARCETVTVPTGGPTGVLELSRAGPGTLRVAGWALDPDTAGSIPVHVYVDGVGRANVPADRRRTDVARAWPAWGPNHGFDVTIDGVGAGPHRVCVFAIDATAPGGNSQLGCPTVTVASGSPVGVVEAAVPRDAGLVVAGWALDPDTAGSIPVHVYVDGVGRANVPADRERTDVARVWPGWGSGHGFRVEVGSLRPGPHEVCVYGIDAAGAGGTTLLGCRTVEVSASPFGVLEASAPGPVSVRVTGWAIDPDTAAPVEVHLYLDGVGRANVSAAGERADLSVSYSLWGPDHGFDHVVGGIAAGDHELCAYALNVAGAGGTTLLGCQRFTVTGGSPFGFVELVRRNGNEVRVAGWGMDPDTPDPIDVHVYLDGVGTSVRADIMRTDLSAAYPTYGGSHGFDARITTPTTPREACVFLYNTGAGTNTLLGCHLL